MEFECESKDEFDVLILCAAHEGDVTLMKTQLSTIADPTIYLNRVYNEPDGQKCTLLMIACLNEYKDMVHMLLETFEFDLEILNVANIMDRDRRLETFQDVSVLWAAAALNNFEIVKLLVKHGAEINHTTKTNSTPLRCACCNDNIDMARYLVENGADVRIAKEKHYTNLVASVFNGHLQMVTYLVDELGCDVNECLDDGRSPLSAAVYHGSLKLVQFLLDRGAQNLYARYDQMSPLILAAEKRHTELVDTISSHCSLLEQIEAKELLASAFVCIEHGDSDLEQSFGHFSRALELRSTHHLPKTVKESTKEVFNHQQECQTMDQLEELRSNPDNMYIEALLVRERLLGPTNAKYHNSLRYRGAALADNAQYHPGIALWLYELALHQQYSMDIDKEDLRHFVSLFSDMMFISLSIPIDALQTVITVTVEELERNTTDFDYNLHTLLFLITIASQILFEIHLSNDERRVFYQLIRSIRQRQYITHAFGSTLLHLSLCEWTSADDYHFDHIYKYPCLHTVRLLLQCGADINATNVERSTPLHVFVSNLRRCDETILQLLCDAGAHMDCVNDLKETPMDVALHSNIKQLLKARMKLSLKCLCARLIQKVKIPFHGKISNSLVTFVKRH